MGKVNSFFEFSAGQVRFLIVSCAAAVLLALVFFIQSWTTPTQDAISLPVIVGEAEQPVTGVFTLDPNTAPADSLELLDGIGRKLADRIVAYRQHDRFEEEIDITNVHGIGPKLYERIRPFLKVNRR